jgi:senataxin
MELAMQNALPERFTLNESDIVVLKQPGNSKQILAKVQGFRRKFKDMGLKVRILSMMDQKELGGRAKWQLKKHVS